MNISVNEPNRPRLDLTKSRTHWDTRTKIRRGLWMLCWWLLFRPSPRRLGAKWRAALLRLFGARISGHTFIAASCRILQPWKLEIGPTTAIGEGVEIYNFGEVKIGSQTVVSQRTFLCTGSHDYSHPHFPLIWKPITIGNEVWVCAEVFVHPGVTVGDGSVIGARSVVTESMPEWMVCAGHPCKPLKPRVLRAVGDEPFVGGPIA